MKAARDNESRVYYHYTEFGKRARDEGYRGIAYLFRPSRPQSRCTPATSAGC